MKNTILILILIGAVNNVMKDLALFQATQAAQARSALIVVEKIK